MPVAALRPVQCLLGAEAQLAAFAAAVQGASPLQDASPDASSDASSLRGAPPLLVLPAPELFQAPVSFAALRRLAGDLTPPPPEGDLAPGRRGEDATPRRRGDEVVLPEQALHLRFGPARLVRLLKGARTAAVLAEQPAAPPIALGEHPFGGGLLPAGVAEALLYAPPAAEGSHPAPPRRFDRQSPLGASLPWRLLPERFVTADLPRLAEPGPAPPGPALPGPARPGPALPGLELHALDALGDGWPDARAADARAAFDDATSRPGAVAVLLPWNLAHPGSIVPDLVQKLARLGPGQPGGCVPVLLPFNGGAAERAGVASVVRGWLAGSPDPGQAARAGFVARVRDPAAAAALRHSIPFAWLDGGDPEHGWTLRRLAALGLRVVTLRPPGLAPAGADATPRSADVTAAGTDVTAAGTDAPGADVTAEERLPLSVRDASGARLYRAATVSARRLPALMAITRAWAPVPRAPAAPAAAGAGSLGPTAPGTAPSATGVPAPTPATDAARPTPEAPLEGESGPVRRGPRASCASDAAAPATEPVHDAADPAEAIGDRPAAPLAIDLADAGAARSAAAPSANAAAHPVDGLATSPAGIPVPGRHA